MSDALTDLSRDQDRAKRYRDFLIALVNFVAEPTPALRTAAMGAAKAVDKVRGGYHGRETRLVATAQETLTGLELDDVPTWIKFLTALSDLDPNYAAEIQDKHAPKALKNCVIVKVDYGYGFVHFAGGFEAAIAERIKAAGGTTYRGENYFIAIPRKAIEAAQVFITPQS